MASLKDLIVMGPARFLDRLYGNLEGNAATATKLQTGAAINGTTFDGSTPITTKVWGTAQNITIGSTTKGVDGSEAYNWTHAQIGATVSNAWEAGTSAGPKIKTTVNGVTGTAVAIPIATASASGVVTNAAQTFAGNKMFNGDILLYMGDSDRSIVFSYANSTTISPSASWRIAGLGSGSGDTNYFVIQSGTSGTAGTETWNNIVRIGQNTFDIALGGNIYPLTNNSKSLGTSSYQWKDAWFSGTVTITKTTDANGSADNKPALIVGGLSTSQHLELDANELMSKSNGTTPTDLYLNSDGGLVHIGAGGLQVDSGNIHATSASGGTADRSIKVTNANGSVGILTSTNQGLYDFNRSTWIIYKGKDTTSTYIPEWASIGAAADRPIYMSSSGRPAITTYRMAATNATATSALSITTDLPTGIWYVNGTSDILGQSDGVCYANQYNSAWISEIYQDYRTGQLAVRGKNNGTWQAWRKILDSSNYSTWALPLSGGTMTGLITGKTENTSWIGTTRRGAFRTETASSGGSANAVISMKTATGAWAIANVTGNDNLYFVFGTDTNYSAGTNSTSNYTISTSGHFSGSCASSSSCTGNAASATKLQTARTIFGQSFNGTANIAGKAYVYGSYNATVNNRYGTGAIEIRENGLVGNAQSDIAYAPQIGFHWANKCAGQLALNSSAQFCFIKQDGTTATVVANLSGNASTATQLATARNFTIGGTARSFNGTAAVSWTKSEIGIVSALQNQYTSSTGINLNSYKQGRVTVTSGAASNSNKPANGAQAFTMWNSMILSNGLGFCNDASTWQYVVQFFCDHAGNLALRGISSDGTAGNYSYQSWRMIPYYTGTSTTIGGSNRPIYLNSGTLTACSAVGVSYGGTGATDKANAKKNLGINYGASLPTSGMAEGDIFYVVSG